MHIEKYKIDKEDERFSRCVKITHELYKASIVGPCVLGVVVISGGVIYRFAPPAKPPETQISKNISSKALQNRHTRNTDLRKNNDGKVIRIAKEKAKDSNTLLLMEFNQKEALMAIRQTNRLKCYQLTSCNHERIDQER